MIYNLGRVVPIFKGDYNANTTYNFLDVVYYDNSSFVALDTTTGNLPTDTEHWLPVALKGTTQDPTPAQIQQIISTVETYIQENNYVQDANYTHIDIVDNLKTDNAGKALSANQGVELAHRTNMIRFVGNGNTRAGGEISTAVYCLANHKYRFYVSNTTPDVSGVSYTTSGYDFFLINNRLNSDTYQNLFRLGCDVKNNPLQPYYDVETVYNGIVYVLMRLTSGETLDFMVEDITALDEGINSIATTYGEAINQINEEIQEINHNAFNSPIVYTKDDIKKCEVVSRGKLYSVAAGNNIGKTLSQLTNTSTSGTTSYKIPIEKGKYLYARFRGYSSPGNYGHPMFDENNLFVGYLGMNSTLNGDRIYSCSPIPSTATYIVFSLYNNSSVGTLELYTEDTTETKKLNDALYGRDDTLYLNTDSTTDIYNLNFLRGGNGFTPSHIGNNIFKGGTDFYYSGSGTAKYLIPIKGYDTVQFTTFKTSSNYGSAVLDKDGNIIATIYRTYTADDYLTRPYTIPENAYYIAWTPTTSSGVQNRVILKKEKTLDIGSEGSNAVATPNISFRHGYYSSGGVFYNDSTTKAVSSFINLGKPFRFSVNSDYCIKRIYMFNGNGEMITYNDILPQSGTSYDGRSYNLNLPQYNIVFEIQRKDGEDIDVGANIVKEYFRSDDMRVHRVIPENTSWKYFQQRDRQVKNITWKALEKMPQCISQAGTRYTDYFFLKGSVNHGIPYSEAAEFSKYVGWNVSFKTFLTALQNKRSVAYTENIAGSHRQTRYSLRHNCLGDLASNYYGTVCTGFTTYMTGINNTIVSTNWASISGMSVVACGRHQEGNEFVIGSSFSGGTQATGEDIFNLVQPMDFVWNNGHCSVLTDVYVDDDGNRVAVCWDEQTMPRTQSTFYSKNGFISRLNSIINTSGDGYGDYKEWKVYRYSNFATTLTKNLKFDESDDPDTPYINTNLFDYSPTELTIDPEICTYEGDYVAWKTNEDSTSTIVVPINNGSQVLNYTILLNNNRCLLNVHRGGTKYTKLVIESDEETRAIAPIEYSLADGNAWISESIKDSNNNYIYSEDAPDNEDWIIFDLKKITTPLGSGLWKAKLSNADGSVVSGYTHFEMIGITTFDVVKNQDNSYTATFSVDGGTPYLIRQENQTGMYRLRHAITSTELTNGTVNFPYSSTTSYSSIQNLSYNPFLKLYVQGKYGDVVYRILIPTE